MKTLEFPFFDRVIYVPLYSNVNKFNHMEPEGYVLYVRTTNIVETDPCWVYFYKRI